MSSVLKKADKLNLSLSLSLLLLWFIAHATKSAYYEWNHMSMVSCQKDPTRHPR